MSTTYKLKVDPTTNNTWTAVDSENAKGLVEILTMQWTEADGTSDLEIQESVGVVGGADYVKTRETDGTSTIVYTSDAATPVNVYDEPIPMYLPLWYKDNGGGSNKLIIKVRTVE